MVHNGAHMFRLKMIETTTHNVIDYEAPRFQ